MGVRKRKKGGWRVWISPDTGYHNFELDELFWFTQTRKGYEHGINTYVMTMATQIPRQILAFDVDNLIKTRTIQKMVNSINPAIKYSTDGATIYKSIDFYPGVHKRNMVDKSDTHIIESTNSDLRHYIAGLRRRSRCFFRKLSTLKAVLWILINAYNKFGHWKYHHFAKTPKAARDLPFNHTRFI